MIKIVDYGVGNIQALLKIFKRLGVDADRVSNPESLEDASHLILPGVGNFDNAMRSLNDSGLRSSLDKAVLENKIPILGVCVGMQMMATNSEEGSLSGLDWIPGQIKSFAGNENASSLPLPHMGWNTLDSYKKSKLFLSGFEKPPEFYFLHSYYYDALDSSDVAANSFYGIDFHAAIAHDNIYGIQCHPEKSHKWGMQLLQNFSKI